MSKQLVKVVRRYLALLTLLLTKERLSRKYLNEPLLFRIIESKYNEDDGYIGYKPEGVTKLKYWTTTFTQAEHGDTDPEAICNAVGIEYKPDCEYTILLIDHQKPMKSAICIALFPPTRE